MDDQEKFQGFEDPKSNFFLTPHAIIESFPLFSTMAEVMIVFYVLRHTWGFQEFDEGKRITVDEFMKGRKRRDGTRLDNGTGLTAPAIRLGIERAIEHGFIVVEVDDSDKARVKKYYMLHMKQGERIFPSARKNLSSEEKEPLPRTKKETKEKKPKKETSKGASAAPPAVLAYREIARRYPNKALYEDIAKAIGESPEQLEKWAALVKDWIGRGWNPANIAGMLDVWAKGGIEPRQQPNAKRQQPYTPPTEADLEAMAQQNAEYEAYAAAQNTPPQPATASPALHTFASGKTPAQVWHGALETLRGQLQQATFDTWLGGSRYHGFEDGVLIIQVQSENARQWLEKRLNTKVARALELWAGETVEVRYIVNGGD